MTSATVDTPIGRVLIRASERGVVSLHFSDTASIVPQCPMTERAKLQIEEYFAGTRKQFDIPLDISGTEFQMSVWQELLRIRYGETLSYGEIARRVGRDKAFRAVGMANNRNPVPLIVPCHRVIGSDGSLTGYGEGIWRKEWLLAHEKKFSEVDVDPIS